MIPGLKVLNAGHKVPAPQSMLWLLFSYKVTITAMMRSCQEKPDGPKSAIGFVQAGSLRVLAAKNLLHRFPGAQPAAI